MILLVVGGWTWIWKFNLTWLVVKSTSKRSDFIMNLKFGGSFEKEVSEGDEYTVSTPNFGQSMRKTPAVTRKARAREVQKNVS